MHRLHKRQLRSTTVRITARLAAKVDSRPVSFATPRRKFTSFSRMIKIMAKGKAAIMP
jgi:hypothetical protein